MPITISPSGIESQESFGTPEVTRARIFVPSIDSLEAFGTPSLSRPRKILSPSGIASLEALGTPAIVLEGSALPVTPINHFTIHSGNLILNPDLVIVSNTATDAGYPITNLYHPFVTRPVIFVSGTTVELIFDLNAIDAGERELTGVAILGDIGEGNTVNIKANDALSWGSPSFNQTKTVNLDYDTDPDFFSSYGYSPNISDVATGVLLTYVSLTHDIGNLRYLRILLTFAEAKEFELYKLFFGWSDRVSVNILKGWEQGYEDSAFDVELNNASKRFHQNNVIDVLKFEFDYQDKTDARKIRYFNYELGKRYVFISVEPENVNQWDEIRQDALTFYGQLTIKQIDDNRGYHKYKYVGTFEKVSAKPVTNYLPIPTLQLVAPSSIASLEAFGTPTVTVESELIAHTAAGSTNSTSVTTSAIDTTGANLLIAALIWSNGDDNPNNSTTQTIEDSKGNIWELLNAVGDIGGGADAAGTRIQYMYVANPIVGINHTFTADDWPVFQVPRPVLLIAAFNVPNDTDSEVTVAGGSASLVTSLVDQHINGDMTNVLMVIALGWDTAAISNLAINNNFELLDQVARSGNNKGGAMAWRLFNAAIDTEPTWNWTTGVTAISSRRIWIE